MVSQKTPLTSPGIRFAVPLLVFFLCVVGASVTHWVWIRNFGLFPLLPIRWHMVIGLLIALAGSIFMVSAWLHFIFIGTTVTTSTPVDLLVENGSFRYSRNPMYVGFITLLFAGSVILLSWPFLVATGIMFLYLALYVIPREERYLAVAFGKNYEDYCNRVRRWF